MDKPILVDLPYPSIDDLQTDYYSAEIISKAYAGTHGELATILQYVYHHLNFQDAEQYEIASTLMAISIGEMKHLDILGETLLKLGVDPIFTRFPPYKCDYFNTSNVRYSKTPKKMIMDDITGELVAIEEYKDMINRLKNENVSAIISRIILDEELHVKVLKDILSRIK